MDDASCFIHYKSIKFPDKLTLISETSFGSLSECKAIRQKLGGGNGHDEQCNNIPENWVEGKKMYYHRECYQKFVYARTLLKRKTSEETELENGKPKSRRRRSDALTTEEIQEDYTRCVSKMELDSTSNDKEDVTGDFNAVCSLVEESVLEDLQCLSMDTLLMSYGIGVGDRQRRLALKERLKKKYQEKLIFVSPEYHSPQVVFSKDCIETQSMAKALQFSD
eukprot:gene11300-21488_t